MKTIEALTGLLILLLGFALAVPMICYAQEIEILPVNAPEIQVRTVHLMTAEERSTILINDIWKQPELDKVKIGVGAALSKRMASDTPAYPYGWQAFVSQEAIGSWRGGYEAVAYGGL